MKLVNCIVNCSVKDCIEYSVWSSVEGFVLIYSGRWHNWKRVSSSVFMTLYFSFSIETYFRWERRIR